MADLTHLATADIGALHCVLYRDAAGAHLVSLFARGPGGMPGRWLGMFAVDGALPITAAAKALAWARDVPRRCR